MRYKAARMAALAAAGKGKDADKLLEQDKSKLRRQALDWLRADLTLWRKQSQSGKVEEVLLLTQTLPQWRRDPDLPACAMPRNWLRCPKGSRNPGISSGPI